MQPSTQAAFSLLEFLLVMACLITLFTMSIPLFSSKHSVSVRVVAHRLQQHLELAKSISMNTQQTVTVCGSINGLTCSDDWQQGYMVFTDVNSPVLFQRMEKSIMNIQWRGFASTKQLHFMPKWQQSTSNGSFILEDSLGNRQKIIINRLGRIRIEQNTK